MAEESSNSPAKVSQKFTTLLLYIGRRHVQRDHEPVSSLELEWFVARLIGLNVVRHHYKTVISGRAPIFQVVHHHRVVGISLKAVQLHFRGLSAVNGGVRFILVEFPGVNVPYCGLERVPLYGEDMRDD